MFHRQAIDTQWQLAYTTPSLGKDLENQLKSLTGNITYDMRKRITNILFESMIQYGM